MDEKLVKLSGLKGGVFFNALNDDEVFIKVNSEMVGNEVTGIKVAGTGFLDIGEVWSFHRDEIVVIIDTKIIDYVVKRV